MAELVRERYANALYEVASESKSEEKVLAELEEIAKVYQQNPEYVKLLSSPAISIDEKHSLLSSAFKGKVSDCLFNFSMILADNGRFNSFYEIAEEYRRVHENKLGLLPVEAVTALPLSKELFAKLESKLCEVSKKKVQLKNVVDESLIGGILLRYSNTEVDASVISQLDAMKRQIKNFSV